VAFISDENQRYSSAQNVVRNYGRNDPAAARQWVRELGLPEDKATRLLDQIPKP
jgi:hypothetical protein